MDSEVKQVVNTGIIIVWLSLLTVGVGVHFVRGIEAKSEPEEVRSDGLLRYEDGQIRAYYHWGSRCATTEICQVLGIESLRSELENRVNCLEAGGHKWRFLKKEEEVAYLFSERHVIAEWYVFNCANCKRKKSKSINGLTCEERDALQELNILGD